MAKTFYNIYYTPTRSKTADFKRRGQNTIAHKQRTKFVNIISSNMEYIEALFDLSFEDRSKVNKYGCYSLYAILHLSCFQLHIWHRKSY